MLAKKSFAPCSRLFGLARVNSSGKLHSSVTVRIWDCESALSFSAKAGCHLDNSVGIYFGGSLHVARKHGALHFIWMERALKHTCNDQRNVYSAAHWRNSPPKHMILNRCWWQGARPRSNQIACHTNRTHLNPADNNKAPPTQPAQGRYIEISRVVIADAGVYNFHLILIFAQCCAAQRITLNYW